MSDVIVPSQQGNQVNVIVSGTLQGPQGFQGIQGPQGSQGLTGPQGIQGPQGIPGSSGGSASETEFYLIDANGTRRKYTANIDGSLHFETVSSGGVGISTYGNAQYNTNGNYVYS